MAPNLGTWLVGMVAMGWWLDLVTLELFSNLNDLMNQPKGWGPEVSSRILHRQMGKETNKQTNLPKIQFLMDLKPIQNPPFGKG